MTLNELPLTVVLSFCKSKGFCLVGWYEHELCLFFHLNSFAFSWFICTSVLVTTLPPHSVSSNPYFSALAVHKIKINCYFELFCFALLCLISLLYISLGNSKPITKNLYQPFNSHPSITLHQSLSSPCIHLPWSISVLSHEVTFFHGLCTYLLSVRAVFLTSISLPGSVPTY